MGDRADKIVDSDGAKASRITLAQMSRGACGTVSSITLEDADAEALGPMGLRLDASVRVCRSGEPCIIEVGCTTGMCRRIGVSRQVAQGVMVKPD